MSYQHTNSKGVTYFLRTSDVTLCGGKHQTIYFFTKSQAENPKGVPCDLPEGYVVVETPRNGFLMLKKKAA